MKRFGIARAVAVLLIGGVACADAGTPTSDTTWTSGGVPACSTHSAQFSPVMIGDGSGGAILAWEDWRFSTGAIFTQRLNGAGVVVSGWPDSGLAVANTTGGYDAAIAEDGAGGALISWSDGTLVVFKHVGADGMVISSAQLSAGDRTVNAAGGFSAQKLQEKFTPVVISDGSGGAFAAWQSANIVGGYIEIQRLTSSGFAAPGWPQPKIIDITYFYASQPLLSPDGAGGVLLAWVDGMSRLRLLRMTGAGGFAPGWDSLGVAISPSPNAQDSPGMVSDGAGGALVFWSEPRGGGGTQLFAQRITASGEIGATWPAAGLLVCVHNTAAGLVRSGRVGPVTYTAVAADGAGGALVTWSDQRSDSGDVYVQHIQSDGSIAPGWSSDGVAACTASGLQQHADLAVDADGVIVAWEDSRAGGDPKLYAQRITPAGVAGTTWPPNGTAVCSDDHAQLSPRIVSDQSLGAVISWEDHRGPAPRIYAARLAGDGAVAVDMSLVGSEVGEGFASLIWYVNASTGTPVTVERRSAGQPWAALSTEFVGSSGEVAFEDKGVVAGARYGYRIGLAVAGGVRYSAETVLDIPLQQVLDLARIRPNPSVDRVVIRFTLPDARPAQLEIVDVAGRLVETHDVGGLGPGDHVLSRTGEREWPAGLYFVRLRHGSSIRVQRFAIVR